MVLVYNGKVVLNSAPNGSNYGETAMGDVERLGASQSQPNDTERFILTATDEQLLKVARGTALSDNPLVKGFDNPEAVHFFQKTDDLRKLILQSYKKNADLKRQIVYTVGNLFGSQP